MPSIVLPKAEQCADIALLRQKGAPAVLPLIETALGLRQALEIAQQPGVERLLLGSDDFSLVLGLHEGAEELQYLRSHLVLASRLAGILPPVDGVTTALNDGERILDDARRAHRNGFGGKLCIHPGQVPHVHAAFAPSAQEVAWAERVLRAVGDMNGTAVALGGKMIDRPVLLKAQAIMEEAGRVRGGCDWRTGSPPHGSSLHGTLLLFLFITCSG